MHQESLMYGSRLFTGPLGLVISHSRRGPPDKPNYHLILPTGPARLDSGSNHAIITLTISFSLEIFHITVIRPTLADPGCEEARGLSDQAIIIYSMD